MNTKVMYFLTFSAGVAVGIAASWKLLKTKYERIAQEEIDSVKEVFSKRAGTVDPLDVNKKIEETEKLEYEAITSAYTTDDKNEGEDKVDLEVIHPEELGNVDEYDTTTLYYYSDGVLVTLEDEVVENVEEVVGRESLGHFGEYEDDSVCVRNHTRKCDYEILKDLRVYYELKKPVRPSETED